MDQHRRPEGFTLLELVIIVAILAILAVLVVPVYEDALDQAREVKAIGDLKEMEREILRFEREEGELPTSLAEVLDEVPLDPWDQPYVYLRFEEDAGRFPKGARADKNLRPINTRFDLYSIGADGQTNTQFTAKVSRDDIVRAADGHYFGRAENY